MPATLETPRTKREEKEVALEKLTPFDIFAPTFWNVSPWMARFREEMDRIFEGLGMGRFLPVEPPVSVAWTPQIEVFEKNGQFIVRADLPGLSKEDVKIELTDEAIILQGERKLEKEERKEGLYRTERRYGAFYRVIPLPEGIEVEKASATFKKGVLEIMMPAPKREEKKGRRLDIKEAT